MKTNPILSDVSFVNYMGDSVLLDPSKHAKVKAKPLEESSHKGWRVRGIPPGAVEAGKDALEVLRLSAASRGAKVPAPWDEDAFRRKFKKKAVRSKPYELRDAATVCQELAEKAGWTNVEIVEVKKELAA